MIIPVESCIACRHWKSDEFCICLCGSYGIQLCWRRNLICKYSDEDLKKKEWNIWVSDKKSRGKSINGNGSTRPSDKVRWGLFDFSIYF